MTRHNEDVLSRCLLSLYSPLFGDIDIGKYTHRQEDFPSVVHNHVCTLRHTHVLAELQAPGMGGLLPNEEQKGGRGMGREGDGG